MPGAAYPTESVWTLRRVQDDPIVFLEQLARAGDVVDFVVAGRAAFLLNHPDHVEDVLVTNHVKFKKPPALRRSGELLGTGLLTAEGSLHQERRRVAQPAFSPQRLAGYGDVVTAAARRMSHAWQDGATIDIASSMQALTMEIIGRLLFGRDLTAHAAEVSRAMSAIAQSLDPLLAFLAPRLRRKAATAFLRTFVDRLIDEYSEYGEPGEHGEHDASRETSDGMVTLLRRAEESQGQSPSQQLRDDVTTLFVAGHDTIANALVWTWHLLGRTPEVAEKLREELSVVLGGSEPRFEHLEQLAYTRAVLSEALRLYPPAWILTRQAVEEHTIGRTRIPAGAIVVVSQYLIHRDARFFPDPLAFRPERWIADRGAERPRLSYFPFGAGPRSCIGQGLAMMEGPLILATLAAKWRCQPLGPIDADPRATLRPRGAVPVRVESATAVARS
jgi:cytochrome P450